VLAPIYRLQRTRSPETSFVGIVAAPLMPGVSWQERMRTLALFSLVAVLHFVLSVVGILVVLPAAFDTQAGFWAAPGKAMLAWTSTVLLAPLDWARPFLPEGAGFGYMEIAAVSVLFGAAVVGLARLWRALRDHKGNGNSAS
jgi:hypothetical protein